MRKTFYNIVIAITIMVAIFVTTTIPVMAAQSGDVNQSGKVDLADAQLVLKAALNITKLSSEKVMAADVNHNGRADLKDAQLILKVALNIISLNIKMTDEEIYNRLVEHYKKGTEDEEGSGMTVMEGSFDNETIYSTSVRCGVPGNPYASQRLYEVVVNAFTGDVTQTRVLTDNKVVTFNLFNE